MSILRASVTLMIWLIAIGSGCTCDDSTCGSAESATWSLAVDPDTLAEAELVACRNDVCWTASLTPLVNPPVQQPRLLLPAAPRDESDEIMTLDVWAAVGEADVAFELSWELRASASVRKGDVLSARIQTSAGEQLQAAEGTVARYDEASNTCESYACRTATIQLAPQ